MASSRAAVLTRFLVAATFVAAAVSLVVWSGRDRPSPPDATTGDGATLAAAPLVAPDLEAGVPDAAADEVPVDQVGELRVDSDDVDPQRPEWRFVAGVARRADSGLPTGVTLSGVDADGEPTPTKTTNTFGGFTGRITDETVALVFTPNSTDLRKVTVPLGRGDDWMSLDVVLPVARGVLRARVVDERGSGVAGVSVAAGRGRRTTDERGNVWFRPLRDGTYSVWLTDVPFSTYGAAQRRRVELAGGAPTEPVVFVVPRGATLRGSVVEEGTQEPVDGVDVVLTRPATRSAHRAARTDDKGYFEFHGLVPGPYRLAATATDGVHGRLVLELPPLRTDEVRSVEIPIVAGAGDLVGQALDEDDAPVPFAAIEATREGEAGTERLSTRTDSHGRFRLKALPAGTWFVGPSAGYCRTHNWVEGSPATASVRPGAETDVLVRLRAGSFLEGQVVSTSDRRDLLVRIHLDDDHVLERSLGHQGRFAVGGVRPGTYLVEAVDPAGDRTVALASRMVYVAAGENATVRLEVP